MHVRVHVFVYTSAVEGAVAVEREREGEGGRVRVRRQAHGLVAHVVAHDERVVDPNTPTIAARRRSIVATVTLTTVAAGPTQATKSAARKPWRRPAKRARAYDSDDDSEYDFPIS